MKIFNLLQNIPKWLWVSLGVLGVIAPEAGGYLTSAGYQTEWLDVITKITLWIVGFSPVPIKNSGGKFLSFAFAFFICLQHRFSQPICSKQLLSARLQKAA